SPLLATAAGFFAGMLAGAMTGVLHTKFKINGLLSGILVMTALYSINLHVMGRSNVPLLSAATFASDAERILTRIGGNPEVSVLRWQVATRDAAVLALVLVTIALAATALYAFLRTDVGTAMRATGNNPQMIRAL